MPEEWQVVFRRDTKGQQLRTLIRNLSVDAREALLVEKQKLDMYGPDTDEITEALDARYELFWRELHGTGLVMGAVHDVVQRKVTILTVEENPPATDLRGGLSSFAARSACKRSEIWKMSDNRFGILGFAGKFTDFSVGTPGTLGIGASFAALPNRPKLGAWYLDPVLACGLPYAQPPFYGQIQAINAAPPTPSPPMVMEIGDCMIVTLTIGPLATTDLKIYCHDDKITVQTIAGFALDVPIPVRTDPTKIAATLGPGVLMISLTKGDHESTMSDSPEKDPFFNELLSESSALREQWEEHAPARKLALSLVGMRRKAGLTQKQLADATGWDQGYVSRTQIRTRSAPQLGNRTTLRRSMRWAIRLPPDRQGRFSDLDGSVSGSPILAGRRMQSYHRRTKRHLVVRLSRPARAVDAHVASNEVGSVRKTASSTRTSQGPSTCCQTTIGRR